LPKERIELWVVALAGLVPVAFLLAYWTMFGFAGDFAHREVLQHEVVRGQFTLFLSGFHYSMLVGLTLNRCRGRAAMVVLVACLTGWGIVGLGFSTFGNELFLALVEFVLQFYGVLIVEISLVGAWLGYQLVWRLSGWPLGFFPKNRAFGR
jgi:hypothetical protein